MNNALKRKWREAVVALFAPSVGTANLRPKVEPEPPSQTRNESATHLIVTLMKHL
jgi:hypothetical protein